MRIHVKTDVDDSIYANINYFDAEMAKGMAEEIFPEAVKRLQNQVAHWKSPPQFEPELEHVSGEWRLYFIPVGFMGRLWDYHVRGVEGRMIKPRFKKAIAFRPKTGPAGPDGRVVVSQFYWKGIPPKRKEYVEDAFTEAAPTMREKLRAVVKRGFQAMQEAGALGPVRTGTSIPGPTGRFMGTPGAAPGSIGSALEGIEF